MIAVLSDLGRPPLTPPSALEGDMCAGYTCQRNSTLLVAAPSPYAPLYNSRQNGSDQTNMSTSANETTVSEDLEIYEFYQSLLRCTLMTGQLSFLWMLFAMIVLGNSAVIVALMLSKNRKSRMNYFITHLAIADLTVGMINVLTDIVWRITVAFYGGNIVCKVIKYLQVLVTYSSTYVLVALSIDRYDAITHPMNFSSSWIRARILIASAWGLSAIFSIPAIFLNEEAEIRGRPQCWIDLNPLQWQIYITLVAMSLFFIPALIISACYSIIVYTIWTKSKLMAYPKLTKTSSTKGIAGKRDSDPDRKRTSSRGVIPKAKIKTVKMTFVIVFVFILCWSPYFIYDLLQVYGYIPNNQSSIAVSTFIQSLAPLNSAANPIIYCLFSTRICRNLRKLALFDWLARHLCPSCTSAQQSLTDATTVTRFSESTNLTETSRSIRNPAKNQVQMTTRPSDTMILKKHIVDKKSLKNGILNAPGNDHV